MQFTRPRELIVAGLVGLVVVYLLFEVAYGRMPSLPTAAGGTLLVLAGIEVGLGFVVRGRIREGRVVTGLGIARAVALAKASSLLGALMSGAWLAAVVFLAPQSGRLTAAASDLPAAIVGTACAGILVGAALWLEHCCRAPDTGDRDE
ncbi:hypothetical protein BJF85_12660 [Saccharomonospora sp. CUA-673]|uniref:DUF3180 domain-containing protein n=1 Tax=Saccharomonospora sp. CUA-673 TaxID=1904969 RepID=UPI000964A877|nr:DUF3180 domain-containing protein [Saccharomonospora sp. CUA-673]OLT48376.1 hypothetical protein BJF85_12660 [Saccharomonospora sp. CUA-673]